MRKKLMLIIVLGTVLTLSGLFYTLIQTGKIIPQAAGTLPSITFSPGTGTYEVGKTFNLDIMLDTATKSTDGVRISLNYAPDKLQVQDKDSAQAGVQIATGFIPDFSQYMGNLADPNTGKITVSGLDFNTTPYSNSGPVKFASVTFKVLPISASPTQTSVHINAILGDTSEGTIISEPVTGNNILGAVGEDAVFTLETPEPLPVSVDLKANKSNGPITIGYDTAANLTWSSANASSCRASGDWSGSKALKGSQSTGNLTSAKVYTLTCTGSKSVSDTVRVNVGAKPCDEGWICQGDTKGFRAKDCSFTQTQNCDNGCENGSCKEAPVDEGGDTGSTTETPSSTPEVTSTPSTTNKSTPPPPPKSITRIPNYVTPTTSTFSSPTKIKGTSMNPWALWFLFVFIPAFLTTGAAWLYLRKKKSLQEEEEDLI